MQSIPAIYLSLDNPHDVGSWSGTSYFMGRALERAGFSLEIFGGFSVKNPLYYRLKSKLTRMRGWDYNILAETRVLRSYARQAEAAMQGARGAVVLSCGKPHLTYLRTALPIVFFDDGSVPAITRLYPGHRNYAPSLLKKSLAAEREVLNRCLYACYMSDYAAESARETYGREVADKIKVVPIGANMEALPPADAVESDITSRERGRCNLLFVGVDWVRKGGSIAVAVCEELRRRGLEVRLDIVGCTPPTAMPGFVRLHGFVSKKTAEGRALMSQLYQESHFLLLPSQAEAYGVAFVEACSHGVPCIACEVGGVPTIVKNGMNGWLFPPEAPASRYAEQILSCWRDTAAYQALCRTSYEASQGRLSWKQFGETVFNLVSQRLK